MKKNIIAILLFTFSFLTFSAPKYIIVDNLVYDVFKLIDVNYRSHLVSKLSDPNAKIYISDDEENKTVDILSLVAKDTYIESLRAAQNATNLSGNVYMVNSDTSISSTPKHSLPGSFSKIAANYYQTFVLKSDNSLWGTGDNLTNVLGVYTGYRFVQSFIKTSENVSDIFPGQYHTLIMKNGTLWGAGSYCYPEFGLGENSSVDLSEFVDLSLIMSNVSKVSAGSGNTMVVKSDGSLWGTGYNESGQLGDGTKIDRSTYQKILESNVSNVFTSNQHSFIIKDDGSVWATGENYFGQLGIGEVNGVGEQKVSFQRIDDIGLNVEKIDISGDSSFALKEDGTLWATGSRVYGQIGTSINFVKIMENVKDIGVGMGHGVVLKEDGTVWAAGENENGQLGNGTNNDSYKFVQVAEDVEQIAVGQEHTLILKKDGTIWGTGRNSSGQLGNGTNISENKFVQLFE